MANKKGQQNRKNASVQSQNSLDPNSNQSLQEQLEHYKKLVSSLTDKIAGMDKLVISQADKISRMNNLLLRAVAENKRREEIVEGFRQMLFKTGNTSESNIVAKYMKASKPEQEKVECGRQSSLFDGDNNVFNEIEKESSALAGNGALTKELDLPEEQNTDRQKTSGKKNRKKQKKTERLSLTGNGLDKLGLEVVERFIDDGPEAGICPKCHGIMDEMATETVSKSLMFRPASYYILETKRRVYKCPACQKNNDRFIRKQESPAVLLPHSVVSPSLLAHVITQKFVYSMPLYRQEQQMIDAGIPIVRKVLSDWCQKVFSNQLENFCELLRQELFKYGHIHADETPVEVIKTHEGRKPKQQYMWVYSTTKWAPHQIRYFKHECGRSSDYPLKFLKGFEGYLHTDGYTGYDKTVRESRGKIIRCECLVHARRHFADILKLAKDKQNSETMLAAKAVTLLDRVFVVEKEANLSCVDGSGVRDPEKVKALRLEKTKPILDEFFIFCQGIKDARCCLPKSRLSQGVQYVLDRSQELMNFLNDGNCDVSNNTAENSIRPFTVGRKNFLFNFTENGADVSAGYYTIIQTAIANGLAPYKYLEWLLTEISSVRPKNVLSNMSHLLPWSDKVPADCRSNNLEDLRKAETASKD